MADNKKMSVAEILAAARAGSSKGAASPPAESGLPSEPPAAEAQVEKPKPSPSPTPAAAGGRPNVADILALARANKQPAADVATKPAPAAKPTPKAAAAKPAATPAPTNKAPANPGPRVNATTSISAA